MQRATSSSPRKIVGLGFLPEEARHGFLIDIPRGSGTTDMVCITEHRSSDLDHLGARAVDAPPLYTMTVATTGHAMQKGLGWRKALRAAIADNPFVKGEGLSPRARRELLGHSQLSLTL